MSAAGAADDSCRSTAARSRNPWWRANYSDTRKVRSRAAMTDKKGLVQDANGGVLFLDEVGDMPAYVQVCFLRFLDSGELRRVGETALRRASVRVIAATNRDLASDVLIGRFRQDLFYRLGVVMLKMPALRERRGDIMALAEHYLKYVSSRLGLRVLGFTPDVAALLKTYAWPSNVREFGHCPRDLGALRGGNVGIARADSPTTPCRPNAHVVRRR